MRIIFADQIFHGDGCHPVTTSPFSFFRMHKEMQKDFKLTTSRGIQVRSKKLFCLSRKALVHIKILVTSMFENEGPANYFCFLLKFTLLSFTLTFFYSSAVFSLFLFFHFFFLHFLFSSLLFVFFSVEL